MPSNYPPIYPQVQTIVTQPFLVQSYPSNGFATTIVQEQPKDVQHCCHFFLFLLTGGLWAPCWLGACCGCYEICEILSKLLLPNIQMRLTFNSITNYITIPITSLTFYQYSLNDLWQLFKYIPMLKYLHLETLDDRSYINNRLDPADIYALHLQQLVVDYSKCSFEIYRLLLKQTPNLKILTINIEYESDIIDDVRWQNLIESSLQHLDIFNFIFVIRIDDIILTKVHQFQNDFWHKYHHWYVNYEFNSFHAIFYTIPYINNEYSLKPNMKRSDGFTLMNNSKVFKNVTDLFLFVDILNEHYEYYFQNITSLTLYQDSMLFKELDFNQQQQQQQENKFVESLQITVNLSNLKHLNIKNTCHIISSSMLLQILKKAPKLSSIAIEKSALISFVINNELCQYFNQMIKKLDIKSYSKDRFIQFDELNELCKILLNIEELQCCIEQTDVFLFIINHMPKLKNLEIDYLYAFRRETCAWLKMTASKLNIKCTVVGYCYL
ncbi:unnamed protein product [Adineta steineri]|uniref:Uncharacterized protein n=1 Tax=Adineta steineri TaxID=433720 RepID=A0A818VNT3_9BILA|nr:unnamed protein product [Adineta steineri]